jgi:hypothetical protein
VTRGKPLEMKVSQPRIIMSIAKDPIIYIKYLFQDEIEDVNINDFVFQIESVYKGLGIPTLYGALSVLANKNVFFIGGRGLGKTRLINCIPDFEDVETSKWDTFTFEELNNFCGEHEETEYEGIIGKHFGFKVEDFSTLSEYHREIFLTVCSKISSDGNYIHKTEKFPHLKIKDSKLTLLIAVQPILYSKLCNRYQQWESMATDRFTKFMLLNPLRENTSDEEIIATFPKKLPYKAEIPNDVDLAKLVTLFNGQVSEGRAFLYARDYAKAIARFQGKIEVSQEDVDLFYKLFNPYLEPFTKLQKRENLESTVTVPSGHMELLAEIAKHLGGTTKAELADSLIVTTRHIERGVVFLLEKRLIRKQEGRYFLSGELEEFFNWYKSVFSAQMSQCAT